MTCLGAGIGSGRAHQVTGVVGRFMLQPAQWYDFVSFTKETAERFLLVTMTAVGLTSMFAGIAKIGFRPFALGLFAAVLIGGVSFAFIAMLRPALIESFT